jgi:hypothetical protein
MFDRWMCVVDDDTVLVKKQHCLEFDLLDRVNELSPHYNDLVLRVVEKTGILQIVVLAMELKVLEDELSTDRRASDPRVTERLPNDFINFVARSFVH